MLKKLSIIALLGGTALGADQPAVRIVAITPMEPSTVLARAAGGTAFDPFANQPRGDGRTVTDPEKPNTEPGPLKKFGKWMDDKAKAVKKSLITPPEQPPPRVGNATASPTQEPPRSGLKSLFEKAPSQPQQKVNAANPAYRWYGWGTTVPGSNQYAPAGDYPHGSAQWYTQTGATPGAFPTPTMNPYRPEPGQSPPQYVATQTVPPPAVMNYPPPAPVIPPPRTIAESIPVKSALPAPVIPAPVVMPPPPVVPPREPVKAVPPTEQLIVPVIRGQEPSFDDSPLAKSIQTACKGLAKVTITETGPAQLTITFRTKTMLNAEIAAKMVSDMPAVRGYEVQYRAGVLE